MQILYTASATTTGGRNGHGKSEDGVLDVRFAVPKAMGGPGTPGSTTPEDLFAAGYAACFGSALEFVGRQHKKVLKQIEVTARVSIGKREEGGFGLATELDVRLPELSRSDAEDLVAEAHKVCPYSNATRGNMEVKLSVLD